MKPAKPANPDSQTRFGISPGRLWLGGLLAASVIGLTVIGCGWSGPSHSVRFNGGLSYEEFHRLPPLPQAETSLTKQPPTGFNYMDGEDEPSSYELDRQREAQVSTAWELAGQAEQNGDWRALRQQLQTYLKLTDLFDEMKGLSPDRQLRRNSALDRLDVLQSAASSKGIRAYFAARQAYDFARGLRAGQTLAASENSADPLQLLAVIPPEAGLRDNILYLRGALELLDGQAAAAAQSFQQLATSFPRSEKHESALFMTAAATMKSSCSYTGRSGDDAHNYNEPERSGARDHQTIPEPCIDAAWRAAQQKFQQYLAVRPTGRYSGEARGWLAYLHLRGGERAHALIEYYRMLGDERDENSRREAVLSLTFTRHHASDVEIQRVEAELADEPKAALAYAYHNLYNYAIDPGCGSFWYSSSDWEWQQGHMRRTARSANERKRIAAFATRLMQRYPHTNLGGAFALRVAQANLEQGENQAAREFAGRALQARLNQTERRQALFIKGAAEQRLNEYPAARQTLSSLLAETQDVELTEGPRRMLAMAAEDAGDYDTALEQYCALGYKSDVAYLIDVLLTPEQLGAFLERHPAHVQRNQFRYALGVRLLRAGRWQEARAALSQVKPGTCAFEQTETYPYSPYSKATNPKEVMTVQGDEVCADWVLRDLKTIDDLEHLEHDAAQATGAEAEAEALYQLASYQYEGGTMLFYNPAAWNGSRHFLLSELASAGRYRAPNEARLLLEAAQQHDALARALTIYQQVARRFPETRAARDALYTAAVCHERLSDMNNYWRGIYNQGLFAGTRLVTYADVKKAYPKYQLPRGTWGWEPVTRTVSGQPAWLLPPKPNPRPPFKVRLKLKLSAAWQSLAATLAQGWAQFVWPVLSQGWVQFVWPVLVGLFWGISAVTLAYALIVVVFLRQRGVTNVEANEILRLNLRYDPSAMNPGESVVEKIINAKEKPR
jgi:TolA-binding protein